MDNEESEGAAEKLEGVLTKDELSRAQRYDATLKIIREKARVREEPYYWADNLLVRKPYHPQEKALVIVPGIARTQVLRMAHNTPIAGHFGRERTLQAIRERMDWPGIAKNVKELSASCPTCQKPKPAITTKAPFHTLPIQKEPFARMAMDVFGPLPPTKAGNKYILVVMDYHTKWPEAFALRNVTSETVENCLIEITARTRIPEELLTDNVSNFISKAMQRYWEITGIKQIRTSTYYPQTDGMVERFNATLKQLLKKLTQSLGVQWDKCLTYILWAYRGTTHKTTGFSTYHLLFGRPMRMPWTKCSGIDRVKKREMSVVQPST